MSDEDSAAGSPPAEEAAATSTQALHEGELPVAQDWRALAERIVPRVAPELAESTIMLVDDEPLNLEITQALLRQAGYRRFVAVSESQQVLPLLRAEAPGVLLLDLHMPGVDGMDILMAMRADHALRHVPTIVLTSETDTQRKLRALALGASDFLTKPFQPTELALKVRNLLATAAHRDLVAHQDPLTRLPNKLRYRQVLGEVLARATGRGGAGAILHVGVDGLGRINDALGRSVGDQLLQRLARRLGAGVQSEAHGPLSSPQHNPLLFRYDGDEFAIVLPEVVRPSSAATYIGKVLEDSVVSVNRSAGQELLATCSIGVAMFPADGTEPDVLMSHAGLALRQAKLAGPHAYEFFSPRFDEQARQRLDLGADLRRAIGRDEIQLRYAPRVAVADGTLRAAQAVLRWTHGSGRVVEGDELLELAGHTEMDVALLDWILDQAREHVRQWNEAGCTAPPLAIPVPLAHVRPEDLLQMVELAVADERVLQPRQLLLELRQSVAPEHVPAPMSAVLRELHQRGAGLALDRFGTRGASMAQLLGLPIGALKVDAAFTRSLREPEGRDLLLGVGDFARRLRLACVACDVRQRHEHAFLVRNGWDQAQGPLYGEALPAPDFAARWLPSAHGSQAQRRPNGAAAPGFPRGRRGMPRA